MTWLFWGLIFPPFSPILKGGYTIKKLSIIIFALLVATALYADDEVSVGFHNFQWGTSMETFKARMGNPAHVSEVNGLQSLVYDNIRVSGYPVFMLAYFSRNGLEGGTYYFNTTSLDELMKCYTDMQTELTALYGPTLLFDRMLREMRPYETSWNFPSGYVYLKANTSRNEPVTLWYSSPTLTRILTGS
ncbi:MAG: hypothetical protein LBI28_03360 [Treponema sp.]|jgi:hypothetical protein|nr:hypothetical protein [Treponema sp.]